MDLPLALTTRKKRMPTNRTALKIRLLSDFFNVFGDLLSLHQRTSVVIKCEDWSLELGALTPPTTSRQSSALRCHRVKKTHRVLVSQVELVSGAGSGTVRHAQFRRDAPSPSNYYPLRRQRLLRLFSSSASFRS